MLPPMRLSVLGHLGTLRGAEGADRPTPFGSLISTGGLPLNALGGFTSAGWPDNLTKAPSRQRCQQLRRNIRRMSLVCQ